MNIGEIVKFKIPGLNGPKNVAGTIKRILPDGKLEIKSQQDGYWTIDRLEIIPKNLTMP